MRRYAPTPIGVAGYPHWYCPYVIEDVRGIPQEVAAIWWQRRRFTALLVTHDVEEALVLATRVVVLSARPAGSSRA